MRIIVYGSIVYDRIMDFPGFFNDHILPDQIHKLSVSFTVTEFRETFGGAGGNIAYNLSLLKEEPLLYGSVGRDFDKYRKHFKKIDISGVKVHQKDYTASAYIMTDKSDNQITGFFPGAMRYHGKVPKFKKNDLVIISPGNPNEMLDFAERCFIKKVTFIFDPGQAVILFTKSQLRKVIKQATVYIVNDYELSLTKKITGLSNKDILQKAGILITTLGKKGSLIEIKSKKYKVKSSPIKKVADPTGAGDAYRAGLIKGIVFNKKQFLKKDYLKMPWSKIGQMGSIASCYAIENYGTQNHKYSYNQFKERYNKEFKI